MANNKKNEYICPYCLSRFNYDNFWFACDLPPELKKKHDKICEQLAKSPNKIKKIRKDMGYPESQEDYPDNEIINDCGNGYFKGTEKHKPEEVPGFGKCYYCGKPATHHICPNCHQEIEIDSNAKQFIINLAGNKTSGKTVYLGALLYAINYKLPDITNGWYVELNDYAQSMCDEFGKFLAGKSCEHYRDGSGQVQSKPAIATFKRDGKSFSFIFYDIAGETLTSKAPIRDKIVTANQFSYPDYIILLNDPAQIKGIGTDVTGSRANVPQSVKDFFKGEKHIDAEYRRSLPRSEKIIFDVAEFIKGIKNYRATTGAEIDNATKQDIPIAVCMSMVDMLRQLYTEDELADKEFAFLRPSTYLEDYDLQKFFSELPSRSKSMKRRYKKWKETPVLGVVDQKFAESRYFGVSSLGADYDDICNGVIKDIDEQYKPINVLDPFLWILSHGARDIVDNGTINLDFDDNDDDDDDDYDYDDE